jgi:fibrillarin-like rRNA methylase
VLAVKAQSISSSRDPEEIFEDVKESLKTQFRLVDEVDLELFEKDHLVLKMRPK